MHLASEVRSGSLTELKEAVESPELGTADKPLANATNGNHHVNQEVNEWQPG